VIISPKYNPYFVPVGGQLSLTCNASRPRALRWSRTTRTRTTDSSEYRRPETIRTGENGFSTVHSRKGSLLTKNNFSFDDDANYTCATVGIFRKARYTVNVVAVDGKLLGQELERVKLLSAVGSKKNLFCLLTAKKRHRCQRRTKRCRTSLTF